MTWAKWFERRGLVIGVAVGVLLGLTVAAVALDRPVGQDGSGQGGDDGGSKPEGNGDNGDNNVGGVKITEEGTFTGYYRDTDLRVVLRQLSMLSQKNIIATKEVEGRVTATLYDVTFDEALDSVITSSGFVYRVKGKFIYVYTPQQLTDILKAQRKIAVKTFRLSYITAADAKVLIAPALSSGGSISVTPASSVGIEPNSTAAGGDNYATSDLLVVSDYVENIKHIEKIIKEIDVKPDQVLIETTILSATLTEDNLLGVNFNFLHHIDFDGLNSTSNGMTQLTTGTLTDILPAPLHHATTARTDFAAVPGGFTFGLLTDRIALFIQALETITDVKVLANPKLLVINKQKGEVMIGNRDGYLTTTVTETTATQTVEFLETGTRLIVRPFIARDGHIRLEVHPEDSSGNVVGGLPSETTTEVTTNVLVRDGHTVVMGGLFRESTQNARSQIPVVGNVPLLGTLFRRTNDSTDREEVIILITPYIVEQDAAEAVGERMKDDVERYRTGARKGLKWWSASRVSRWHMAMARWHMKGGRTLLARCETAAALAVDPQMIEAIELKEQLTEKAYWSDEARHSSIRFLVQKMMMQELGKDPRAVIPVDRPIILETLPQDVRKTFGIRKGTEALSNK